MFGLSLYIIKGSEASIVVIMASLTTREAHHSPRAVVNFPSRQWSHNNQNWDVNFYSIMTKPNDV